MSFVTEWSLYCDYEGEAMATMAGCHIGSDSEMDKGSMLKSAAEDGWLITGRKHYCPYCRRFVPAKRSKKPRKEG